MQDPSDILRNLRSEQPCTFCKSYHEGVDMKIVLDVTLRFSISCLNSCLINIVFFLSSILTYLPNRGKSKVVLVFLFCTCSGISLVSLFLFHGFFDFPVQRECGVTLICNVHVKIITSNRMLFLEMASDTLESRKAIPRGTARSICKEFCAIDV